MPTFSPKTSRSYNVRSISFPARLHPTFQTLQQELNKLKTCDPPTNSSSKSDTICSNLHSLGEMYKSIEDILNLPMTQQALEQNQSEKWVNGMLDDLIRYLDVCGNTRDSLLLMKESVRDSQSTLRRQMMSNNNNKNNNIESNVMNGYVFTRKKMKSEMANALASLKQTGGNNFVGDEIILCKKILGEASLVTKSIFGSLLLFLSVPRVKPKASKWSLVSKWVKVASYYGQEDGMINELEGVDVAVMGLVSSKELEGKKVEYAQKKLEDLEICIEKFEGELECLFRSLIHARVTLLNILSR